MTLGLKAYRIMMGHLTRKTPDKKISDLINTGKLKTADEVSQPPIRQDVEQTEAFNEFNKRNPKADGGRMEYSKGNRVSVENVPNLFTITHTDGKKMYEAGVISKNTDLGPALKRRFPFTKQGKEDAINAIKTHKEKYPNISKKTLYKGQTTIQKGKDGILKYQRKNQPTKYYDPKKYGSEVKAFAAAKKDVEAAQVAKKTSAVKNVDVKEIKKLRNENLSVQKIANKLGVDQRLIRDRLEKEGMYVKKPINVRTILPETQKDIKAKYSSVKNWDFNKYTYGVSPTADIRLYDRIRDFVDEPKPYEIAGDFSKAEGWLASQMNRSYKLGNPDYKPIKAMVNNKNKIVGFIDNTKFGGGKKYIVNERFIKGKNADAVLFSDHVDYNNTAKFIDISKKAKLPVQGTLKELLKNEGVDTTRISLSDLFKTMKNKVGYDGVKNALEKHHISGVKNRATGNYQLLDRDLNALAREVSKEIEQGDLSRVGELKKRGAMVEVGGKLYGSGPKTPEGQFKRFEKQVTDFFKDSPRSKEIINMLKSPQFASKIPLVTDLFNMAASIPGDLKKKSYLKAGFKSLGIAAAPLVVYDTYKAFEQGKPFLEAIEQGFVGTDLIGGTKRILSLTPEERTARSVVKQDALKDLNVDMPMGFGFVEGPTPKTNISLEEAKQKMDAGIQRVREEEAKKNLLRSQNRGFGTPVMADQFLVNGGIVGVKSGPPPEKGPNSQGLPSLIKRVKKL